MAKIINFNDKSVVPEGEDPRLSVENILKDVAEKNLQTIIVIGSDKDGVAFIASNETHEGVVYMMTKVTHFLMDQ